MHSIVATTFNQSKPLTYGKVSISKIQQSTLDQASILVTENGKRADFMRRL
jgi:hypothetical protein